MQRLGDNAEQPLPSPCRMTMPCRWSDGGLSEFTGRVRFRRSFGYPGRIDAYERVWLTFDGVDGEAKVQLNNRLLGRITNVESPVLPACEFEVTSLLRPRNELAVEIEGEAEWGGLWGEVALEVRCTAFLRDLRRIAIKKGDSVDLHVSGQVVGMAERPLEVYLVFDRSVVGYQVVAATAEGQPFQFAVSGLPGGDLPVQVDLVNGAVVWYTSSSVPTPSAGTENVSDQGK